MNLAQRVPNKFKNPVNADDITTANYNTPVRHIISVSEANSRIEAMLLERDRMMEKSEQLKRCLVGIDLRIEVIQGEIQRLKKKWKAI